MPSPRTFGSNVILLLSRCGRQLDDYVFRRSLYSAAPIADLAAQPLAVGCRDIGCNRRRRKHSAMETQLKELHKGAQDILDLKDTSTVGGGEGDTFGEDAATEDQTITPWARIVASGSELLRDPRYNKGLAFTEEERDRHYLRGLLPPTIISQELQTEHVLQNMRSYKNPLEKYISLMDLQERNERLFYKVLIDHVEKLLPIVYTPVVGEACQKYGNIFRRPRGLYISLKDRGHVLDLLKNWPEKNVEVIVVTDGERILGLGDLGLNGMGIPVGKLALYTALGGIRPSSEYDDFLDEFMMACKQAYGEKVLVQFEDFANHNAFRLLLKYVATHLVFNDDIQGTAAVALAGLAALPITGGTLADHKFLFLGAGEAGAGIAEIIALEVSRQRKMTVEEARKAIHLVDSKGLVTKSRYDSLQEHKRPYAHAQPPVHDLLSAVKLLKPGVRRMGSSSLGRRLVCHHISWIRFVGSSTMLLARDLSMEERLGLLEAQAKSQANQMAILRDHMEKQAKSQEKQAKSQEKQVKQMAILRGYMEKEAKIKSEQILLLRDQYSDMKATWQMKEAKESLHASKIEGLETKIEGLEAKIEDLEWQVKSQTFIHVEWCQRDLSVVAAEVLKWSVGAKTTPDGDGRHFYDPRKYKEVKIGAWVFRRTVPDYKNFSRGIILDRNSQVYLGSVKDLDARVATAQMYITHFGGYLRKFKQREVEVIEAYPALKMALPDQFK